MASIADIKATINNFASDEAGLLETASGSVDNKLGWYGLVTVHPSDLVDPDVKAVMKPAVAALSFDQMVDALVGMWLVHDHADGLRATRYSTRPARDAAWNALRAEYGTTEYAAGQS